MNINEYLNRIGFEGNIDPSLKVLKALQKYHLFNVPFENLDIHYNRKIELDVNKLYNKIVTQRRGGFCYELNGLFYELLIAIGFDAKRISAKVYNEENGYGEEFDHLAILVNINNAEYLADVGFGEFSSTPLKLDLNTRQEDSRGIFFFDKFDHEYLRINKIDNETNIPQYIFTITERELNEFEEMCNYHQTSPNSHFTLKKTITIPTENGRITLTSNKCKLTENQKVEEMPVLTAEEYDKLLQKYFKIKI